MKKQQMSQSPYQQNIQQKVGAITRKCKYCKSEVPAKEKICPNCQKKLTGISAPVALVIIILIIAFAIIMATLPKKSTSSNINTSHNITIPLEVLDCSAFNRISVDVLCEKLGNPKGVEDWNNINSKGEFQMQIYTYDIKDFYAEFIIYEDTVVKLRLFSNSEWTIESAKFNDIFAMFGIEPGDDIRKTVDTGVTYKFSPVSDEVAEFEVYDYDKNNATFKIVYVTYDLNYFV